MEELYDLNDAEKYLSLCIFNCVVILMQNGCTKEEYIDWCNEAWANVESIGFDKMKRGLSILMERDLEKKLENYVRIE